MGGRQRTSIFFEKEKGKKSEKQGKKGYKKKK